MSDCFITRRGFNKTKSNGNILTLLKDGETKGGLTSFKHLNTPQASGGHMALCGDMGVAINAPYYYMMYKAYSYDSNNPDSFIISTKEKIDLTNYNYIMFNFLSSTNLGNNDYSNFGGGYFRIDEPENLPINNTAYNWGDWDVVFTRNKIIDLFIKDISNIKGQHNLCFGLCHGTYTNAYTNYFAFNNLLLI